jgi:hypothetical protein
MGMASLKCKITYALSFQRGRGRAPIGAILYQVCQLCEIDFLCAGDASDEDVLERELAAERSQEAFHASAKEGEALQDMDRCPSWLY